MPERSVVSAAATALLTCTLVIAAGCAEEIPLPGPGPAPAPAPAPAPGPAPVPGTVSGPAPHITFPPTRTDWLPTKAACGGVYNYTKESTSWTGYSTTSRVEISNDRPTRRDVETRRTRYENGRAVVEVVSRTSENAAALAALPESGSARTMEQIHDACENGVLRKDPAKNEIRFERPADGVVRICSYRPYNCADDCVISVGVDGFACGPLP